MLRPNDTIENHLGRFVKLRAMLSLNLRKVKGKKRRPAERLYEILTDGYPPHFSKTSPGKQLDT